ncbi:2-dehydropantoate 2-reductase [Halomonas campisalis]|uniref:2-dehydropantoate 2-reductase n=1 Tax=Billgrantia campisalis TaxID=74661 RepID=A0ABS9P811_9GAMM|nr:2-dehydropantoate 2-reductase [Halomonas campisalis]MCG6657903.1 2-dehydropantoate 2-reductase [Halomonas campisalis]MDR5863573.1 2-dehydropantoate 2-reductase [Halomonas campisalis]
MTHLPAHWILGPGALGRLVGLRLAEQATVTLIGRRSLPVEQTLITPDGASRSRRVAVARLDALPGDTPGVIHLTTKAYAAEAAYEAIALRLPADTPLVLWQNGFDCQPRLAARHPGPVLCATTTEGAYVQSDAQVVHAGHGETLVGTLDGRHAELAGTLADTLSAAGLKAFAVTDIRHRLWQKLAVNAAINPLVARFRIRNGQLRDRPFRPLVEAVIDEVAAIMAAEGIPAPEEGWHARVWKVVAGTAGNRASMLQDVLADRPTEREAILGPLRDAARRHGLTATRLAELDDWLAADPWLH